jgi:hypothetical protein
VIQLSALDEVLVKYIETEIIDTVIIDLEDAELFILDELKVDGRLTKASVTFVRYTYIIKFDRLTQF